MERIYQLQSNKIKPLGSEFMERNPEAPLAVLSDGLVSREQGATLWQAWVHLAKLPRDRETSPQVMGSVPP
jgi:hypothetical protein